MDQYKIIQVKESVFADNDREADRVRQQLKGQGTFLLNLMSSPGSGKTTTLLRTVEGLKDQLRIGVMEAERLVPRPHHQIILATAIGCKI